MFDPISFHKNFSDRFLLPVQFSGKRDFIGQFTENLQQIYRRFYLYNRIFADEVTERKQWRI